MVVCEVEREFDGCEAATAKKESRAASGLEPDHFIIHTDTVE